MSDFPNLATDTIHAVKSRLAGPIGTFAMVWGLCHLPVLAIVVFDASGNSGISQADAKIEKISQIISSETNIDLFWRPLAWSALAIFSFLLLSVAWHWVSESVFYFRDRITWYREMKISIFRAYNRDPEQFLSKIRNELNSVRNALKAFPNAGSGISAISNEARLQAIVTSNNTNALSEAKKIEELLKEFDAVNKSVLKEVTEFRKQSN